MLNKRLIVAILAVVVLFLGIFSFAQGGNNPEDNDDTKQVDENKDNDNKDDQSIIGDETDDEDDEDDDQQDDEIVPSTNRGTRRVALDTTAPIITIIGDSEIAIDLGDEYTDQGATTNEGTLVTTGSVDTGKAGIYTITYTATDDSNNTSEKTRTVTVRPVIELASSASEEYNFDKTDETGRTLLVEAGSSFTVPSAIALLGLDNNDDITGENIISTINTNVPGTYTLTYTYTLRPTGVAATPLVLNIKVKDTTAPKIKEVWINGINVGYHETIEADKNKTYDPLLATVIGRDENGLDGDVTVEFVNCSVNMGVPSALLPEGAEGYYCRYRLTDAVGNSRTQKRFINVVDTTKPKISQILLDGVNIGYHETIEADKNATYVDRAVVTASDNALGDVKVELVGCSVNMGVPSALLPEGAEGYYCRYRLTDAVGNSRTQKRFINVVDTTKPKISQILLDGVNIGYHETIEADKNATYVDRAVVTASDNALGDVKVELVGCSVNMGVPSALLPEGAEGYYCRYRLTDAVGNSRTQKRFINVVDTTAPSFTVSGNSDVLTNQGVILTVTATDAGVGLHDQAYSFNGVWQTANSITVVENGTIVIKVRDKQGNESNTTSVVIGNIDKILPVIDSVIGNPTDWTNQSVTLTVNASDNSNVLADSAYSFDGGLTWQISNTKTFDENVNAIIIKVKDKAGNISLMKTVSITKIDKGLPIINSVTGNPTNWTSGNVTLTIDASDTKSGLHAEPYSFDNGVSWQAENTKIFTTNDDVNIKVRDKALNETSFEVINITKIDKTGPIITVDPKELAVAYGDSYDNMLGVSATDSQSGLSGAITSNYDPSILNTVGTYTITYTAIDAVGNVSQATRTLTIEDRVGPIITLNQGNNLFKDFMEVNIGYDKTHLTKKYTVSDNYDTNVSVDITTRYNTVQIDRWCFESELKCLLPWNWVYGPYNLIYAIGTTYSAKDSSGNLAENRYYNFEIPRLVNVALVE